MTSGVSRLSTPPPQRIIPSGHANRVPRVVKAEEGAGLEAAEARGRGGGGHDWTIQIATSA